ncbi:hypothetical protein NA57DRAFT_71152 [Rhizodiscina lignyota]|uniref:Uncharacterized protein n=1 Tax=Rhizodiscina lignyota TaxID=1504668 RepID=A0A9P4MBB6_9PEZI|nr:hypothetical protein NA57DRAFT_71152 [Rhizodiscina lignyota]
MKNFLSPRNSSKLEGYNYAALEDHIDEHGEPRDRLKQPGIPAALWKYLMVVQFANLLIFCPIIWLIYMRGAILPSHETLLRYGQRTTFENKQESVFPSTENDHWWRSITYTEDGGVVRLSKDWIAAHSIPESASPPDDPNSGIYQISVFHQLHCLGIIRQRLNDPNNSYFAPSGVGFNHSMHCVDMIRQSLTCNADLALATTEDFYDFDGGWHRCRDFGAIQRWAKKNRFAGHGELIKDRLGNLTIEDGN